jgi:hypothetical protein
MSIIFAQVSARAVAALAAFKIDANITSMKPLVAVHRPHRVTAAAKR